MRAQRSAISWAALAAVAAAVAVILVVGPAAATPDSGQYCSLSKDRICVDYDFSGDSVSVTGLVEPGARVIVKVSSPPSELALARKGKVGPIWMNVSEAHFHNAPAFYKVNCTETLNPLLSEEIMAQLGLGYDGLKRQIEVSPAAEDTADNFKEFIGLKESNHLYEIRPCSVQVDEQGLFHTTFSWPANAPAGPYAVTAYQVKDGKVIHEATGQLRLEKVGVARWLAELAMHNGALYGLLAIVAALGAGVVVGFIFKGAKGGH